MLKFAVMFLCTLCYLRQVWNAPVIKASGIQWTEPKVNGKGNLTLIMIPQNNSCDNNTDMLIAVKSDYQIVSQDTQLLNLVVNEYKNDTVNEKKSKCQVNQNSKSLKDTCEETCTDNIRGNSLTPNRKVEPLLNDKTCESKMGVQNKKIIVDETHGSENMESGLLSQDNQNQQSGLNVSIDFSNEDQLHQSADNLDRKVGKNMKISNNENIKSSDAISYTDFLKYLNSVGEVEQHSELDPHKGVNSVNFYEPEKKSLLPVIEQSNINAGNQNNFIPKNVSAEDVLKFLSAIQNKETTAGLITKNSLDIFKFLKAAEQTHAATPSVNGFNTVDVHNLLNTSDHKDTKSSNASNSKSPNARLFNESEISIFKHLNISEPNIGQKLKKVNEGNVVPNAPLQNEDSNRNIINEVVGKLNVINEIKNEPLKDDHNLRPDLIIHNQNDELVSLDEGDFDNKVKLSKGVYSDSESNGEVLKKRLSRYYLSQIGGSIAEENDIAGNSSGAGTTCYTMNPKNDNKNEVKLTTALPLVEVTSSASHIRATNTMRDSTNLSTCRTSIIYLCDTNPTNVLRKDGGNIAGRPENKSTNPEAADQGSLQKITLEPQIDCAAYLRTKQLPDSKNTPKQSNQPVQLPEKAAFPLIESVMFSANNEMLKGKNVPILFNSSSPDYTMNTFLSGSDGKLAKLQGNLLDANNNEEEGNIPPSQPIDGEIKNETVISLKNTKNNEQSNLLFKVSYAGEKMVLEQLPSGYRSQKIDQNNCDSTPNPKSVNNGMESDGNDNETMQGMSMEAIPGAITGVTPAAKPEVVSGANISVVPGAITDVIPGENTEAIPVEHTETIPGVNMEAIPNTSAAPGAKTGVTPGANTGVTPAAKTGVTPGANTGVTPGANTEAVPGAKMGAITETQKSHTETTTSVERDDRVGSAQELTTIQPEHNEIAYSQSTKQIASKEDKGSQIEKTYVTECKVLINGSQSVSKINENVIEVTVDPIQEEQTTTNPNQDNNESAIIKEKSSNNSNSQSIKILGDSVREIRIQIVRNTRKPGKPNKECYVNGEHQPLLDETSIQNKEIHQLPLDEDSNEKAKPVGYEIEWNDEKNNQDSEQSWNPKPVNLNTEINLTGDYDTHPSLDMDSNMLNNFKVPLGKENIEDSIPEISDNDKINNVNFKGSDKYKPYSDMKLAADNNVIKYI